MSSENRLSNHITLYCIQPATRSCRYRMWLRLTNRESYRSTVHGKSEERADQKEEEFRYQIHRDITNMYLHPG